MDIQRTILEARIKSFKDYGFIDWIIPEKFDTAYRAVNTLVGNDNILEVLFGGAAGGGKSFTGWAWLTLTALSYPGINNVVIRKHGNDLTTSGMSTFREMSEVIGLREDIHWHHHGGLNAILLSLNPKKLNVSNASKIWLKGVDTKKGDKEMQSLGSSLYAYGFIEEAGQVPFLAYDTLAHSRLGRCPVGMKYGLQPKVFISCNPSENWVKTSFYNPWKKNKLPEHKCFIPSYVDDNPFQTDIYKKNLDRIEDEVQRKRLKLGVWEYTEDEYMLCEPDKIEDIFTNDYVKGGRHRLSTDIAMQGKDLWTVLYADGLRLKVVKSKGKSEAKEITRELKELARIHKVSRSNIVFDGVGLGSYLNSYLRGAKSFITNNSPTYKGKEEYANLKSECGWMLAKKINNGKIYFQCEDAELKERIIRELKCLRRKPGDGKLALISKDEMKEYNKGDSTDYLDLMIQLMYYYLLQKEGKTKVESITKTSKFGV